MFPEYDEYDLEDVWSVVGVYSVEEGGDQEQADQEPPLLQEVFPDKLGCPV